MSMVEIHICFDELESWDTFWRWKWFTRDVWESKYWVEEYSTLKPLFCLLRRLNVESILDCSCGLRFKTILLAREGYEVEGSDGSPTAIKYARQLAKREGVKIRFFLSRYVELDKKAKRKYDCVFSDNFDKIETYGKMKVAAESIHLILNENGKLIFQGVSYATSKNDLKKLIEEEWKRRKKFDFDPPCKKRGIRVMRIEVNEK